MCEVGLGWVFCTNIDGSRHVLHFKARLVTKGFSQVHEIGFHEFFALIAKCNTIRCILAFGTAMDLEMHQMDLNTPFLNVDL